MTSEVLIEYWEQLGQSDQNGLNSGKKISHHQLKQVDGSFDMRIKTNLIPGAQWKHNA